METSRKYYQMQSNDQMLKHGLKSSKWKTSSLKTTRKRMYKPVYQDPDGFAKAMQKENLNH